MPTWKNNVPYLQKRMETYNNARGKDKPEVVPEKEGGPLNWTEQEYEEYLNRTGKAKPPELEKKPKYRNNRVKVDGILFDSQLEADYYSDLKLQLHAGVLAGFCRQPVFILQEGLGEVRPITYRADFIVFHLDGTYEIIDTKGFETEEFHLKQKMFFKKFPRLELKVEGCK